MAPRKNTAQAFEVLYRIAKEGEAKRKAKKSASADSVSPASKDKKLEDPAQEDPAQGDPVVPALETPRALPRRLERQPLLAQTSEPEARGRREAARSRFARGRSPRPTGPTKSTSREEPTSRPSTAEAREVVGREHPRSHPRKEAMLLAGEEDLLRTGRLAASSPSSAPDRRRAPPAPMAGEPWSRRPGHDRAESMEAEHVAREERASLLEDEAVAAWIAPLSPSVTAPLVDPALSGLGASDGWPDPRRVRLFEPTDPPRYRDTQSLRPSRTQSGEPQPVDLKLLPHPEVKDLLPVEPCDLPVGAQCFSKEPELPQPLPEPASEHSAAPVNSAPASLLGPDPSPGLTRESSSTILSRGWSAWARGAAWVLGEGSTRWLERCITLKVSTLLVAAIAGVTVTALVLMYLRRPGEEDAHFRSAFGGPGLGSDSAHPAFPSSAPQASATTPPIVQDSVVEVPVSSGNVSVPGSDGSRPGYPVRRFPLWGPGMSVPTDGGGVERSPEPQPEIRHVVSKSGAVPSAASDSTAGRPSEASPQEVKQEPDRSGGTGALYIIQVRAKESMKGAQGILEYLSLFGFDKPLIEGDPQGHRNSYGEELYTVFVGHYTDRDEADRECERLRRETRARPYKGRPAFFSDCLVITRAR